MAFKVPNIRELAKALDGLPRGTKLDILQMAIDLGGIVDPSGGLDIAGAFLSLVRGDLLGAGISAVSALPFGDIAKAGKLGKYGESLRSVILFASRRPELAVTFKKAFRQLDDLLTEVLRLARKGGEGTEAVARQIESMREPLRKYVKRVTDIQRFGSARMARKNGKLARTSEGGPVPGGPHVDKAIRNSRISVGKAVDILENAIESSASKQVRDGAAATLERMALAESWEIRAFIHRSPTSEMNQHFNILIKGDPRQLHVTLDARGHLFRITTLTKKGSMVDLTPR
ncbi:MAG: hypothetical protein AB8G99_02420 [Planctomycetaceae bacterium]